MFNNIKDVLSYQASKVFKFEEQEELHNNIIDKGLLKLCQANLKRAEVMAQEFPDVAGQDADPGRQAVPGGPAVGGGDQAVAARRWRATAPTGSRTPTLGSQAENLLRLAPCNLLLTGTAGIRPEDIPWIEEDGQARPAVGAGSGGADPPRAAVRARASPDARWRNTCMERRRRRPSSPTPRLDEAIREAPADPHAAHHGDRHRGGDRAGRGQGRGAAQEHAGRWAGTTIPSPPGRWSRRSCPITGPRRAAARARRPTRSMWTEEAWDRLQAVPLIARPLARNTVRAVRPEPRHLARHHDG